MTNRILATLGLLSLLTSVSLVAQSDPLKIEIPFAFHVGDKLLPAGHYRVTPGPHPFLSTIRSLDSDMSMMILTEGVYAAKGPKEPTFQFTRYGDAYFLERIWSQGEILGRQLRKSNAELEMARQTPPVQPTLVSLKAR